MGSGQQATRSSATQHLSKCADKKSSQIIDSLSWFLVAAPFVLCEDAGRADTPCGQIIRSRMSVRQWFLCRKVRGDRGGRCFFLHTSGCVPVPLFLRPSFQTRENISKDHLLLIQCPKAFSGSQKSTHTHNHIYMCNII
jgi:hypothetical protein